MGASPERARPVGGDHASLAPGRSSPSRLLPPSPAALAGVGLDPAAILALQRTAGNAAVGGLVAGSPPVAEPTVQRGKERRDQIVAARDLATAASDLAKLVLTDATQAVDKSPDDIAEDLEKADSTVADIREGLAARADEVAALRAASDSAGWLRVKAELHRFEVALAAAQAGRAAMQAVQAAKQADDASASGFIDQADAHLDEAYGAEEHAHATYGGDQKASHRRRAAMSAFDLVLGAGKAVTQARTFVTDTRAPAPVEGAPDGGGRGTDVRAPMVPADVGPEDVVPSDAVAVPGPGRGALVGKVALALLKGVGKGLVNALIGPFKYLIHAQGYDPADDLGKQFWEQNYGSTWMNLLNKAATYVGEFGALMTWLTVTCAILGVVLMAIPFAQPAGAVFAAMAPITGAIAAGAAGFTAVARSVLAAANIVRLIWFIREVHERARAKAQLWNDIAGAAANLVAALTGGFFSAAGGGAFMTEIGEAMTSQVGKNVGTVFGESGVNQAMITVSDTASTTGAVGAEPQERKAQTVARIAAAPVVQRNGPADPEAESSGEMTQAEFVEEVRGELGPVLPEVGARAGKDHTSARTQEQLVGGEVNKLGPVRQEAGLLEGHTRSVERDPSGELDRAEDLLEGKDNGPAPTAPAEPTGAEAEDPGADADLEEAEKKLGEAEARAEGDVTLDEALAASARARAVQPKKPGRLKRFAAAFVKRFGRVKKRARRLIERMRAKLVARIARLPIVRDAVRALGRGLADAGELTPAARASLGHQEEAAGRGAEAAERLDEQLKG